MENGMSSLPDLELIKYLFAKPGLLLKHKFAYQLASAVSYLHEEEIVHRDLHSNNILIYQHAIKLADFGLSKRIEEATKKHSEVFGRWRAVMGDINPFYVKDEEYGVSLAINILQGLIESVIPGTPEYYVNIYT
ncbi:6241_t:CDS:2, partial [Funneliformis geosporum]